MSLSKLTLVIVACLGLVLPARAQVFKMTPEQLIKYTSSNPFDRFPDGRPKVPDSILERVKDMSMEEVFGIERRGFPSQYVGDLKIVKPEKKLVGRAVTLLLMPLRQEVADVDSTGLPPKGPRERQITGQTALNMLRPGDVIVVDAHAISGGIIGDNLATYIKDAGAGFVIDGPISGSGRDQGDRHDRVLSRSRSVVLHQLHGRRHQYPGNHREGDGHARRRRAGR